MARTTDSAPSGGWGCLGLVVLVGALVAGLISLAAVIDPFSWMPPVGDVWADCRDDIDTARDDCDLAVRFPGFWWHAAVNGAWAVAAIGAAGVAVLRAEELRRLRATRFDGPDAHAAWARARDGMRLACGGLVLLGTVPLVVAVAS